MTVSLKSIIEGLLFVSDTPLTPEKISSVTNGVSREKIQKTLDELVTEYEEMNRAFVLVYVAGGYQFRSRAELSAYILQLKKKAPARLSRAALETLSVIAYRQPVLRAEIEKIRGVDVGGTLKTLLERDLIRIVGRKDLPGRPMLYGTTKKFLEIFGLPNLEALPTLDEMESLGWNSDEGRLF
ncbi:MAG: SMC-Scp complex subunit ScpB [Deltaproteobacteria bacterium]|nr:SMC-Scp complex subunit ScpB [Deltaproteobacteria bacterium]